MLKRDKRSYLGQPALTPAMPCQKVSTLIENQLSLSIIFSMLLISKEICLCINLIATRLTEESEYSNYYQTPRRARAARQVRTAPMIGRRRALHAGKVNSLGCRTVRDRKTE